ncbi:hypothetical protein [Polaribacter sargassicola]|uniref:hypothetical protein n=1 Tax=Polaribacter sargassicola TaxID=2836891 RepID=UPI001F48E4C8|nr:hypothetical protein [Polaribacter sp. DS7-9]MCG1036424.1 hypothetical protein [Polaribacter sp. DS7-9]
MKKYYLLFFITFSSSFLFSQTEKIPEKKIQKTFAKIDFLSLSLPDNDPNMGFAGIHYNLMLNNWAYTGLGLYGSVSGNKGGFFTLGVNAGVKKNIADNLYLDTGFHFGGGGGAAAPDGGGAFILPHFNLGYDFKSFSINSGWSYANFFDKGNIRGHQLNIALEIPLEYSYSDYKFSEDEFDFSHLKNSDWNVNSKRISLMFHLNNLKILGDDDNTNIKTFGRATIKLAGFELATYLTKNWFSFLKLDGAYDGIKAGYMDVFLGGGYHLSLNNNNTSILAKFGIGAGGGGSVDSKGGFLLYPDLSIEQKVFDNFFLSINKGYVMSPNSHFHTSSFGLGLKYYVDRNGIISENTSYTSAKFKGIEVITQQEVYFNPAREEGKPTENMQQISVQVNLNLNKNLYVAGQTSFANFGNAGAYAEGIVGLGLNTNPILNDKVSLFAQILAGAAGGGDILTGQGLIAKPSVGLDYQLNNTLSLRSAVGYIKAVGKGEISNPFFNVGIKYHFSLLKLK